MKLPAQTLDNPMRVARLRATVFAALLVVASDVALAQNDVPLVTRTYAIENATVVTAPGQALDSATVIIRDGLIMDVGRNVDIPFDAERITGDSLYVYSGFVDGLSNVGIPAEREERTAGTQAGPGRPSREPDPGNPTYERAGIQPDRLAENVIKADDASIKTHREAGFAVAHVVPRGQMLPGTGALIALTDDPNDQLMKSGVSMFTQFEGARGVYPNTVVAIMAKWRQLYREAERQKNWTAEYAKDPSFLERPPNDKVHAALFPVIDRQMPVTYKADTVLDIYRALQLQDELGFDLVLAAGAQASEMVEQLANTGKPLLLTLKLPKEDAKAKSARGAGAGGQRGGAGRRATATGDEGAEAKTEEKKEDAKEAEAVYDPTLRTTSYQDVDKEKKNLEARRGETRQRYLETPAALEKAGVPFGFTTVDVKSKDVRDNVLKMVEAGLSEDAALAALTINPATILGIASTTGTVQRGKLGNLVVTSGSYFNKDASIRYVFVEGKPFELEVKKDSEDNGAPPVAGTWTVTVTTPDGDVEAVFTFTGEGDSISGTASEGGTVADLENVKVSDNTVTFELEWPEAGHLTAELKIDGDDISGTILMADGTALPVQGTRTSGPSRL
jgi:imidazolonepropionase-like amidohydrolase